MSDALDTLINDGWRNHASDSEAVAASLETADRQALTQVQAGQFLKLSNHTIGEHLNQWPRARALTEIVSKESELMCSTVFSQLAIACFLDNDPVAAQQAEIVCIGKAGDEVMATYLVMKAQLAAALTGSDRLAEGLPIYEATIALADSVAEPLSSDRVIAITSNNIASELLEVTQRCEAQDTLLQACANAAYKYWHKCGTWENRERASYLLARVANALSNHQAAIEHTNAALHTISTNGAEPVDEAFIRLAAADAHKQLHNVELHEAELACADQLAANWDDASLQEWYAGERAKIVN